MAEIQEKLQALSEEYQKLQEELQNAVQSRQKLEAQRQENLGVQKVRLHQGILVDHRQVIVLTGDRSSTG